jgi:hypothetical protein
MYEFVGFKIALPVAIHCFHPYCAARVKFLYANSMCYDVVYDCVNYIAMHMAERCMHEHRPISFSLSPANKWAPLHYFFTRDSFLLGFSGLYIFS